ncbi:MAG: hypothetical protein ACYDCL_04160 [Myxococcales bacterium]
MAKASLWLWIVCLGCSARGLSSHPGPHGSSAGSSQGSGGTSGAGAGSSSTGGVSSGSASTGGTSGGSLSTGGTSGASTSGGTATTGGSSTGGSTGLTDAGGWSVSRVLATDSPDVEVWDLTVPAQAAPLIGHLNDGCTPVALAMAADQEILVLTQCALDVFDADALPAGMVNTALLSVVPTNGLAYLPQDGGPATVVVCGGGLEAFAYGGAASLDGGVVTPALLWSGSFDGGASAGGLGNFVGTFDQCAPGPAGTFFAANGQSGLAWFDGATGNPHGSGSFAAWGGSVSGVAVGPLDETLLVGEDDGGNGFAALFSASGECLVARTGGVCAQNCDACYAADSTLGGNPLDQAASMGDGTFLATILNRDAALANSNRIVRLDGRDRLAPTLDYQGPDVFSGGPQFVGILAWPQGP